MRVSLRRRCAPVVTVLLLACLTLSVGCQPVREDRTISFAAQGDAVGFQHGQEGVFVADKEGGGLMKVFQPGPDVLAVSTPLWAPKGRRLIFTTARAADGSAAAPVSLPGAADPAGAVHVQRPVVYICWLREEAPDGKPPEPVPLFEASCDHVGYVAANLAVRWHPHGDRILYVKAAGNRQHGLFEYDLANKVSRQVFPQTAEALVFDWAPDGEHLVCVLGNHARATTDGIWIGRPGGAWWPVPDSAALAEGELPSLLEQLRATQPAWTADGSRFAFASWVPGVAQDQPGHHFLRVGKLADHTLRTLAEGKEPFRDLRWAPDGSRLGVVEGREPGMLRLVRDEGGLSPLTPRPVRLFAGWDHDGKRLAYVVPEAQAAPAETWAFLLVPNPLARDAVCLANGRGADAGREVFSGMRVTFPHWSPTEDRLSLWVTFCPPYRSWLSRLVMNLGVRLGDPAAVLDPATGKLSWMAVNADEKAQVGHYYLLKHEYAEAWRWYGQAAKERGPAPAEPPPPDLNHLDVFLGARDVTFFEYLCLMKLGRRDEARARLEQFRREFLRLPAEDQGPLLNTHVGEQTMGQRLRALLAPDGLAGALLRDLFMAEAFLSVDQAAEGEAFFRQALREADKDPVRLSHALALSQFLLLEKKHGAYADLAATTIAPLMSRMGRSPSPASQQNGLDLEAVQAWATRTACELSLVPLCSPDFLAKLPDDQARALLRAWQTLPRKEGDEESWLLTDLLLRAAYQRLGMEQECREVARRLEAAPAANGQTVLRADVAAMIGDIRQASQQPWPR